MIKIKSRLIAIKLEMEPETADDDVAAAADANANIQDLDDNIDLTEINQLEEILANAGSEKVQMLEYERQMFMDMVYNDSLVICAK